MFETFTDHEYQCHDTFEDAVEFAEKNGCETISSVDTFDEFEKCWFCGEWYPTGDMNKDNLCKYCQMAIWSRGEEI